MKEFLDLLKYESDDLTQEFHKASLKGKGTPQEVADFREDYFRKLIAKYYPFPYKITKGGIIDSFDAKSASIDCIICNPIHPYTVDIGDKFSVVFADAVDVAIELKTDLSNKIELERGLKQIQSVKKLRRGQIEVFLACENRLQPLVQPLKTAFTSFK